MNLKKCLAAAVRMVGVMAASTIASAYPALAYAGGGTTKFVTDKVPGNGDASESPVIRDEASPCLPEGSDHWVLYQRLADRSVAESTTRPDFSGDWVLNVKASDDPREKAKEVMRALRQARGGGSGGMGRGGGMGGGRRGHGGMGGLGGGGPSSGELSALAPAQALHMTHQDPMLLIADENDQPRRLYTDFRGASVSASGGLQRRVSVAGWEGAVLVVETTMLGKKLTQSYQIDGKTGQLVIATQARLSNAQSVSYRLVYDRHKPEAEGMRPHQNISTAQGDGHLDRAGSTRGMGKE